jgi:hypothetical protein
MLRTVKCKDTFVQGKLVQNENVFCSCSDGYIPIDKCDCEQGWTKRAVVERQGVLYTGELIPVIVKNPSFTVVVVDDNEDGSCNVEIEMDDFSSEFFHKEATRINKTIEEYIVSLLSKHTEDLIKNE